MTGFDLYLAFALVAVCAASLGYRVGRMVESDERDDREQLSRADQMALIDHHKASAERKLALVNADLTRQNTAVYRMRDELATKQRRVRGILAEARRWRAEAVARGWKRETRGEMHARWAREAKES